MSPRGGRREGAGRKSSQDAPRRPVTIWIAERDRERLKEIGDDNVSEGVRRLVREEAQDTVTDGKVASEISVPLDINPQGHLFHPEHPGQPYTLDDALHDLREAQDQIWTAGRRAPTVVSVETRAATRKIARVQRFLKEGLSDASVG